MRFRFYCKNGKNNSNKAKGRNKTDDLKIPPIAPLNVNQIRKVITSNKISYSDKEKYLQENRTEIKQMLEISITSEDFYELMKSRPLIKFKPLKNSFTKAGDKVLLSKSLNIPLDSVNKYIDEATASLKEIKSEDISAEDFNKIKTYVYRHGKKDQVTAFLNCELQRTKNVKKTIINTLEYGCGGIADYFLRPIHHMDEKTLILLFEAFENKIRFDFESGVIDEKTEQIALTYILGKLYEIQENQRIFK